MHKHVKLIANDELGSRCLKGQCVMGGGGGGGGANAITRENVSMAMATLEVGTTPRAATNRHRHTEKIQWRYLPEKILMKQSSAQQGGRSTNPQ